MLTSPYVHAIEGRLRIKLPAVKSAPDEAFRVETALRNIKGITRVKVNPLTGNLLVLFESDAISHDRVCKALNDLGCFKKEQKTFRSAWGTQQQFENALVKHLINAAIEMAVKRLILTLS